MNSSDPAHPAKSALLEIPSGSSASVGVVVAEWNKEITEALLNGAISTLKQYGVADEDIFVARVPRAAELTFGARQMAIIKEPSAVIVLAAIVKDDTLDFDYICSSVTQGITELNLHNDIPFISGVLMTENLMQAKERAGGSLGNKGIECAESALKMVGMVASLVNS